jgi:hypothetical protein
MRKHRISDEEAAALLRGTAPEARPDLALLAQSIADIRAAAFETLPLPSAELAQRLELSRASDVSLSTAPRSKVDLAKTRTSSGSQKGRVKSLISWILGLGLATKIALGTTLVAAAATGAGVAGALPDGAQNAFDTVVSVVVPSNEESDEESGGETVVEDGSTEGETTDSTFGKTVSERAKELGEDGDGQAFGEEISEEAQELGDEKRSTNAPVEPTVEPTAAPTGRPGAPTEDSTDE